MLLHFFASAPAILCPNPPPVSRPDALPGIGSLLLPEATAGTLPVLSPHLPSMNFFLWRAKLREPRIDTSLPTLYGNADLFASYPGTEATLELAAYANNILAFNLPHNACFHSVLHPSERQAHSVGDRVNFPPVGAQTSGLIPEYILHSSPEDNRPYFNPNLTNTTMSHHDPMVSSSQGRWQHAIPNYYQCDLEVDCFNNHDYHGR
ncbi:hypothetical protein B0H10DRAFT_785364 [Mycena sp. CBHHK59/15]|nr:hypothetical protein B0H10DRAFT_785364 [Mycena sp. CBHHK59/15]